MNIIKHTFIFFFFLQTSIFASENYKFVLNQKIEKTEILSLKNKNKEIMANYHPDNFKIEDLFVKDNIIKYTSVKKFLFITYRVKHDSELFYNENIKCKNEAEEGLQVIMDLSKSESIISNNVSKVIMNICFHHFDNNTKTEINAEVDIEKGPNVSTFFGGIIFKIVYRQAEPIFRAVNKTLEDMHSKKIEGAVISAPIIIIDETSTTRKN